MKQTPVKKRCRKIFDIMNLMDQSEYLKRTSEKVVKNLKGALIYMSDDLLDKLRGILVLEKSKKK